MGKIFGTDGIRGPANLYPMTSEVALTLGRAITYQARKRSVRPKIIVGKDTRLSCYMIEMALVSGICSMGGDALMTGPIPTPGIAYLTTDMRCDAGIMITASHNKYEDNGIKIFGSDGFKLSDEAEEELERYILEHYTTEQLISPDDHSYPMCERVGKAKKIEDARGRYIAHLKSVFPKKYDLSGMRIAVDCANGAAYRIAPAVLEELGATVVTMGVDPNGININELCGATSPNWLSCEVMGYNCDMGIALDGDADRAVFVDHTGCIVHGDAILNAAMIDQIDENRRHNRKEYGANMLVATSMSTLALDESIKGHGGCVKRVGVGDRYVIQEMRRMDNLLGGEQSGHIIYLDHSTTGDGILAALKILGIMKKTHRTLSMLTGWFKPYPQELVNIPVSEKIPLEDIPELQGAIQKAEEKLGKEGRILVRYSGTENKLRIMVEAKDAKLVEQLAETIATAARIDHKTGY